MTSDANRNPKHSVIELKTISSLIVLRQIEQEENNLLSQLIIVLHVLRILASQTLYPVCIVKYFPQACLKLELHVKDTEYAEDTFRLRAFAMHLAHEEQPSHFESVVG